MTLSETELGLPQSLGELSRDEPIRGTQAETLGPRCDQFLISSSNAVETTKEKRKSWLSGTQASIRVVLLQMKMDSLLLTCRWWFRPPSPSGPPPPRSRPTERVRLQFKLQQFEPEQNIVKHGISQKNECGVIYWKIRHQKGIGSISQRLTKHCSGRGVCR